MPGHRLSALILVCAVSATLISGCIGTSKTTHYYNLYSDGPADSEPSGEVFIALGPFEIPDYLDRPQIVIRNQETGVMLMKFDRWAEPLNQTIVRRLGQELNHQVASAFVYPFPSFIKMGANYQIAGDINSFEADENGIVNLQLRWGVLDKDGNVALAPQYSHFSTTVSSSADIPAVTAAMGHLLDELAAEIAQGLESIGIN